MKAPSGDLKVVVHRPGITLLWRVLLVIVCFAIWGVGFIVGGWEERRVPTQLLYEEREHLLAKIVEYRRRIGDLEIQLSQKDVALEIAKSASDKVRADYRTLYEELDALREQVTQYQRVLTPDAGEQGIVMGLLDMQTAEGENLYRFSIDFFQVVERRKVSGDVHLILSGRLGEEVKNWDFQSLAAEEPLQLKLGFMHYQTLSGIISLPDGVQPLEVTVNAEITKGKSVAISKVFTWTLKELSDDLEQVEAEY
jgi:hypothetical protein